MTMRDLRSPRIMTLQREIEAGHAAALETFWREITEQGTPLIEPIPDDDAHAFVTFLWRDTPETRSAVVMSPITEPTSRTLFLQQMTRLPGTDVWYATSWARTDLRATYRLSTGDAFRDFHAVAADPAIIAEAMSTFHPDPLNRQPFPTDDPEWSAVTLPAAPPQPWIIARPDVPSGTIQEHRLRSAILDNERDIWVYLPSGYAARGAAYRLLLLFDGGPYLEWVPTPTILDNLCAADHLPPMVAVLVGHADIGERMRELSCSPAFVDFVAHELMPWVSRSYHVTTDPQQRIVGGSSLGGLTAAFLGLRHPELFGRVLCQSGSFWWAPDDDPEAEWLTRQFVATPHVPLHVYLDAGLHELWTTSATGPNLLIATRHLRDVLLAKGYTVHHAEFNGWHDYISWRGTLADGLMALVG